MVGTKIKFHKALCIDKVLRWPLFLKKKSQFSFTLLAIEKDLTSKNYGDIVKFLFSSHKIYAPSKISDLLPALQISNSLAKDCG